MLEEDEVGKVGLRRKVQWIEVLRHLLEMLGDLFL